MLYKVLYGCCRVKYSVGCLLKLVKSGSSDVSSSYEFYAIKSEFLSKNKDTIRAVLNRGNRGPRR